MVKKNFEDMCSRLGTIPACDRRTDRRADILPWHSPRYAYASRGKKIKYGEKRFLIWRTEFLHPAMWRVALGS